MITCNIEHYANGTLAVNDTASDSAAPPRARSTSRVRFNLDANEAHSPEAVRRRSRRTSTRDDRERESWSDSETTKRKHRRRRKHSSHDDHGRGHSSNRDANAGDEEDSDGTVEMPARFDRHGNKIDETPDSLQALLGGLASKFFSGEEGSGGGGGGGGERDGRSGRRRHRH